MARCAKARCWFGQRVIPPSRRLSARSESSAGAGARMHILSRRQPAECERRRTPEKETSRAVAVRSSRVAAALTDCDTAAVGLRLRGKRAAATRVADRGKAHRHERRHQRAKEHSELHSFVWLGVGLLRKGKPEHGLGGGKEGGLKLAIELETLGLLSTSIGQREVSRVVVEVAGPIQNGVGFHSHDTTK